MAILLLIVNLIIFLVKKYSFKKIVIFLATTISVYFFLNIPKYTLDLNSPNENTSISFSTFILGAYVKEGLIEEDDMKLLTLFFTKDEWIHDYYPYCINSLTPNEKNTEELVKYKEELFNILKKYISKYPKVLIKHQLDSSSLVWKIKQSPYAYTYIVTENSQNPEIGFGFEQRPIFKKLNILATKYVKATMDNNTIVFDILYRPAFAMYVSILLLLLLWYIKREWMFVLITLPMIFNAGILMLLLPAQDIRYLYINFLTFLFVILVFFKEIDCIRQINKKKIKRLNVAK